MTTQKSIRFDDEDYIEEYRKRNGIASFATAVNQIIREHKTNTSNSDIKDTIAFLSDFCTSINFRQNDK